MKTFWVLLMSCWKALPVLVFAVGCALGIGFLRGRPGRGCLVAVASVALPVLGALLISLVGLEGQKLWVMLVLVFGSVLIATLGSGVRGGRDPAEQESAEEPAD